MRARDAVAHQHPMDAVAALLDALDVDASEPWVHEAAQQLGRQLTWL